MVAINDSKSSMAREEREANRHALWQEHILYGGPEPPKELMVANEEDGMMVAGDVHIVQHPQQQQPVNVTAAAPPEQPWYQKHAIPLALAAGLAGFAGNSYLNKPEPPTPAPVIEFDPGALEVSTAPLDDTTNDRP